MKGRVIGGVSAVVALVAVQFGLGVGALPAVAEGSSIAFITPSPVQTAFGGNWNVEIGTSFSDYTSVPIPADQATIDVYLSGVDGVFATRLPIQPDGRAYVSQSAAKTLPPGEYQMTAVLVPVVGSFVVGSQTTTPLTLTITAYAVDASIKVDDASVAAGEPVIEASLSGEFVETTDAVPAGTWAFTVTGGGKTVLDTEVAQEAGSTEALRYAITGKLESGVDYDVSAEFRPVDALAAGLDVAQPSSVTFHTPSGSIADPIPYPLWLLIVTAAVPLGLAIAVIVLTVRAGGRRAAAAGAASGVVVAEPVAAEPVPAEPTWDPFATARPVEPGPVPQADLPQTQVLPREPGEFTQLITPPQPASPPVAPPEPGAPTENWTLSQDPDADQHLR